MACEASVSLRNRHNVLVRHHGADAPVTLEAARDLRAASLAEYITRRVAEAPPLTAEQVERLRGLLPAPSDADGGVRDAS